jgi:hypothetical protein
MNRLLHTIAAAMLIVEDDPDRTSASISCCGGEAADSAAPWNALHFNLD